MKSTFLVGMLLGLIGTLAVAHQLPWGQHLRLASVTTVQPNGGRVEQFLIRLPADRLPTADALAVTAADGEWPPLRMEHFRLRDVDGQVIGVAARHATTTADGPATAWSVVIPGRGSFVLAGRGDAVDAVDRAVAGAGYRSGMAWNANLSVRLATDEPGATRVIGGSREFDGLQGDYSEVWRVTGADDMGELRGTIELTKVTYRPGP